MTSHYTSLAFTRPPAQLHSKFAASLDDSDNLTQQDGNSTTSSLTRASMDDTSEEEEMIEEDECKYSEEELLHTRTPLLTGTSVSAKREEIREYFHKTFSLYERLFDCLAHDSTYYLQPDSLRHPLIFYAAHTAVFYINKLRLAGVLTTRINEDMESTCAIGVDEMSWDDTNSGNYVWPTVSQMKKYRDMCRVVVDDLISSLPLTLPITWEQPFWIILMGCEHERIHLETSSVLFRQLPIDQIKQLPIWEYCKNYRADASSVPKNYLVPIEGGRVTLGKAEHSPDSYGWDNEYGTLTSTVDSFRASSYLVSNAEFEQFVLAGGYEDQSLWGEEGWKFVTWRNARHPKFWVPMDEDAGVQQPTAQLVERVVSNDKTAATTSSSPSSPSTPAPRQSTSDTYLYRTMAALIPMPYDWPVDCNYIEASAFCRWKTRQLRSEGKLGQDEVIRMPTEAEWTRMRDLAYPETAESKDEEIGETRTIKNDQPHWPVTSPSTVHGNINLEHGASSCPIDTYKFGLGLHDVIGNVWQWSETPIAPFRGFKYHPMYDDFSIPTFDTRHNLFFGGSWISTGNEALRSARYAFRRHFYQHAGFRYIQAKELKPIVDASQGQQQSMCESDVAVTAMMDAQYNDAGLIKVTSLLGFPTPSSTSTLLPIQRNYSIRIAEIAMAAYKKYNTTNSTQPKAIDIGSACGRSTFELAKLSFNGVTTPASSTSSSSSSSTPTPSSSLFSHILGLDFSTRFVKVAAQLQYQQHAEYQMRKEGELITYHAIESKKMDISAEEDAKLVSTDECNYIDLDLSTRSLLSSVEFMQGDACNLLSKYSGYDLVLASNLLEYLYSPQSFLLSIGERVQRGGILILASSYSWSSEYTPKEHWLGGMKDSTGESVDSLRNITELLTQTCVTSTNAGFERLTDATMEVPLIWKQNARNYQIKNVQVTVWRKK